MANYAKWEMSIMAMVDDDTAEVQSIISHHCTLTAALANRQPFVSCVGPTAEFDLSDHSVGQKL